MVKKVLTTGSENYCCPCGVCFVIYGHLVQGGCAAQCPGCGNRVML